MILNDAHMMATQVGDLLKAYEKSPDYQAFKQNAPPMPAALQQNRMMHIVASILMPAYDRFVLQQYRGRAERRLVATALALRLYAVEHGGEYPQTLDELLPKYLPAVPIDPFASGEKPLSYSADDPEAPLVYSVGENGTDEGGSQIPNNRRRANPGRWEMSDAVLRMKATPLLKPQTEEEGEKADDEGGG
jgi:hypothetical protein